MDENTEFETELLLASRNGDLDEIKSLLSRKKASDIDLNINCVGKKKANKSWTPLHLSSYFGHRDVVQLLLENGADLNAINDEGDSPLHRASYTGRQDIVTLLIQHHADVNLVNAEGLNPKQVARTAEIKRFIEAAEITEARRNEERFRKAARDGDIETLSELLKSGYPLNVNCVDTYGNSALHLAAQRGRKEIVVLLLQNGVDTMIHNSRGQTALDVATEPRMRLILDVKSIRHLNKNNIHRHEGALFKKVRLLGWKQVWVLLERGVLSVFSSRGDASTGANRKLYRYLEGAKVQTKADARHVLSITFSDRSVMSFSVGTDTNAEITRQKWENALNEHIRYSNNFGKLDGHLFTDDKEDEIVLPLGSLQDTLQTAQAHQQIVESQVAQVSNDVNRVMENGNNGVSDRVGLLSVRQELTQVVESSKEMLGALSHCLAIFTQQEQVRKAELDNERDKSRVLQESLHVLAQEHLALEQSISKCRSPASFCISEAEEFYDCEDSSDDVDDSHFEIDNSKIMTSVAESFTESPVQAIPNVLDRAFAPSELDLGISVWGGRSCLPVPALPRTFSVWNFLKQCIGKELSKITMPVVLNEPLSFLQRTVEYLEYADLLKRASDCTDPIKRMEFVSAFAVSASSSNWERLGKPFNPILGETYELNREDLGFRVVCEQVSHHPPVSALHAESADFCFSGAVQPKLKFWGKSVEVTPKGVVTVHLNRHNESYSWQNVNCCVHNIIVGKIWVEHYGMMEIVCQRTGCRSVLTFKTCGWFGNDLHKVEGFIYDNKADRVRALYGKWTEAMFSCDVAEWENYLNNPESAPLAQQQNGLVTVDTEDFPGQGTSMERRSMYSLGLRNQELLWCAIPKPAYSNKYYNFTLFAMILNELDEKTKASLPPTDSRLRPDIRRMEEGDIDGSAGEKNRLEEKQRAARKERNGDETWKPVWFVQKFNKTTNKEEWVFTGEYWNRDWKNCPDIF